MGAADKTRINNELAYVLHTHPYRETSLLVDLFSRNYGRLTLVARGARRPRSESRGLLLPFQPLALSWFGKGELRTLHRAEWLGGLRPLAGRSIMSGFYINELLLRLLGRDDPHETLFDAYESALRQLSGGAAAAPVLRTFEVDLLAHTGFGLTLNTEADGRTPIQPGDLYDYFVEQGPTLVKNPTQGNFFVHGKTLLDMACRDYQDARTLAEARQLMRHVLGHYLAGRPLNTPQLLKDLQDL